MLRAATHGCPPGTPCQLIDRHPDRTVTVLVPADPNRPDRRRSAPVLAAIRISTRKVRSA